MTSLSTPEPAQPVLISQIAPFKEWEKTAEALKKELRMPFGQPWRPTPEAHFAPGEARLAVQGHDLIFHAVLQDDHPFNKATKLNEETWMLGDVVELFLQKEGSPDYYEFHLTPEGQRLQLHFPHEGAVRSGPPLTSFMVQKNLFESFARINPSKTGWEAFLRVDLRALFGTMPTRLRFLAGRYDYQPGQANPVISCVGGMERCDFHRLVGWCECEIVPRDSNGKP